MLDILVLCFNIVFLTFSVIYFKIKLVKKEESFFFYFAFCYKILAGVVLGLVYSNYYQGGDTLLLFHEARALALVAFQNPADYLHLIFSDEFVNLKNLADPTIPYQPRAFLMVKMISLLNIITFNNYWLISYYFSTASLMGLWVFYHQLKAYYPESRYAGGIALFLMPSVVFWSSGVNKESIALPCIALIAAFFLDRIHFKKINILHLLVVFFCILVLSLIKFYYLAVLLPVLCSCWAVLWLARRFPQNILLKRMGMQVLLFFLFFAGMAFMASLTDSKLNYNHLAEAMVVNHNVSYQSSEIGGAIQYQRLNQKGYYALHSKGWSILYNSPLALVSGLFRPFLWESRSITGLLTGIENVLLLGLSLYAFFYYLLYRDKIKSPLLIFSMIVYICLLACVLAIVSPNFGSLARYKISFMPFLYILVWMPFQDWFLQIFQFKNRLFSKWSNPKNI